MHYLYPQPRPETVAKVRQIIKDKYGRELTLTEATEVCERFIRFLYLSAHPPDMEIPRQEDDTDQPTVLTSRITFSGDLPGTSSKGDGITRRS